VIEGDEESDSSHFDRFVETNRKELAADAAFVCGTELWDKRTPANDGVHSPNEHYDVECFYNVLRTWPRIIDQIDRNGEPA
jgi:acetylornithine deacetylase/succinyl-diaminopimelate desuccinylase-like protein